MRAMCFGSLLSVSVETTLGHSDTDLVSAATLCCSTKMKNRFENWSDVRVFLAVMRAGSTLSASKSLGMAQPTVARRIDALEHALGVTLFDRDTRGFKPTETAQALCAHAEALEQCAIELSDAAKQLAQPQIIRVTAFNANFSARATEIFSDFASIHPEVSFEFLPGVRPLNLLEGEADVALRLTRAKPDPDLIRRKISTAKFGFYASKGYAEKHGLPTSEGDLAGHKFVSFRRDDTPPYFDTYLKSVVDPEQIVMTFHEVDMMSAAIRSGRGIGFMNVRLAEGESDLILCFEPPPVLDAEHLILVSPEAWRRPEVKAFIKFFAPRYAKLYRASS